jgi:hypothetical protein
MEYRDYEPRWMRNAVMDWLDYYQGKANRCRKDIVTQKIARDLEAHREKRRTEEARIGQLLQSLQRK